METRNPKECIVVNLMGGPGVGKTIISKEVFAALKREGIACDESPEYIKRKLREKAMKVIESQLYIFGKQQFQLYTLKDEVDVIITDSPLLNCSIYDKEKCPFLKGLILKEFNKYTNLTYFIERDDNYKYETEGRYQNLEGAKKVDVEVQTFLEQNNIPYETLEGIGSDSLQTILMDVMELIVNR